MPTWIIVVTIGGGYLAGSLSPAYFFGRRLAKIDIRTVGRGHAGASNVYLCVSRRAGVATAAIDVSKGAAVVTASRYLFGATVEVAYLGGFAAVAGHVFPFYLGFRGGRGAATSAGLLMLSISWLMLENPLSFLPEIGILAVVAAGTLWITRNDYLISLVELPLLTCLLLRRYYPRTEATAAAILSTYVYLMSFFHYRREREAAREESLPSKHVPSG